MAISTSSMQPPAHTIRLPWFVLTSLLLHALVLTLGYGTDVATRLLPLGESTLRAEITSAAERPVKHAAAAHALLAATADHALAVRRPDIPAVTGTGAAAAAASHSDPVAIQNYLLGVLQSELARNLRYPALARERGWEGTVLVSVAVTADGTLTAARLLRSSGHALLDQASLSGLRRIHGLPVEGAQLGVDPVEVILPIRFRLADNS